MWARWNVKFRRTDRALEQLLVFSQLWVLILHAASSTENGQQARNQHRILANHINCNRCNSMSANGSLSFRANQLSHITLLTMSSVDFCSKPNIVKASRLNCAHTDVTLSSCTTTSAASDSADSKRFSIRSKTSSLQNKESLNDAIRFNLCKKF